MVNKLLDLDPYPISLQNLNVSCPNGPCPKFHESRSTTLWEQCTV